MMQTRDQVSHTLFDEYGSVGNESAKTPKDRVKLADDAIRFHLAETVQWKLHIHVLLDRRRIVTTRGELQITRLNVAGNFANVQIATGQRCIEGFGSVEVSAGGTDYPEVQHRQC